MTTTFAVNPGQSLVNRWARRAVFAVMSLLGAVALAGQAQAQHVLQDIAYTALPGGKVEVTLKFNGPAVAPQAFATETPPSIALACLRLTQRGAYAVCRTASFAISWASATGSINGWLAVTVSCIRVSSPLFVMCQAASASADCS